MTTPPQITDEKRTASPTPRPRVARLTREVRFSAVVANGRFCIQPAEIVNSWSGHLAGHGIAPHISLRATLLGLVNETRGFVWDVKRVNRMLHKAVQEEMDGRSAATLAPTLLQHLGESLDRQLGDEVRWCQLEMLTSPCLSYRIKPESPDMVYVTQQFEFSAAHRLHSPQLSEEENRAIYGKCNHPSGHGHNYRVDITVGCERADVGTRLDLQELERAVQKEVIKRFDHKHLDEDCLEFSGMPSTVENIAFVIWNRLEGKVPGGSLHNVRVYETPKTWADVGRDDAQAS